jgi:hypothetical protein
MLTSGSVATGKSRRLLPLGTVRAPEWGLAREASPVCISHQLCEGRTLVGFRSYSPSARVRARNQVRLLAHMTLSSCFSYIPPGITLNHRIFSVNRTEGQFPLGILEPKRRFSPAAETGFLQTDQQDRVVWHTPRAAKSQYPVAIKVALAAAIFFAFKPKEQALVPYSSSHILLVFAFFSVTNFENVSFRRNLFRNNALQPELVFTIRCPPAPQCLALE